MGIFSSILDKLGFHHEPPVVAAPTAPVAAVPEIIPEASPSPVSITVIDVMTKLDELAAAHSEPLNWKTSIVDLMKLLGLDSSFGVRKELATELGCPAETMADSATMNMWLHKTVLQKLAENGGNIPKELLS